MLYGIDIMWILQVHKVAVGLAKYALTMIEISYNNLAEQVSFSPLPSHAHTNELCCLECVRDSGLCVDRLQFERKTAYLSF